MPWQLLTYGWRGPVPDWTSGQQDQAGENSISRTSQSAAVIQVTVL
jgi:hypothetical protein